MTRLNELLAGTSLLAAIASWQEQLEWGVRVAASIVALVAGALAIVDWYRRRKKRVELD